MVWCGNRSQRDTQAALLARVPTLLRLANARFKGTTVNLTVVAVYAPTLDAAEEAKDSFFDDRLIF